MIEKNKHAIYLSKQQLQTVNATLEELNQPEIDNIAKLLMFLCENRNKPTENTNNEALEYLQTQYNELAEKHENLLHIEAQKSGQYSLALETEVNNLKTELQYLSNLNVNLEEQLKQTLANQSVNQIVKTEKPTSKGWFWQENLH